MRASTIIVALALLAVSGESFAAFDAWKHSGSVFIDTTEAGADLPASALERDFPLLVRLDAAFFDFSQARPRGEDLRFTDTHGRPLSYQIEHWDPDKGRASVWVKIPTIRGQARQEIRIHWGRSDVRSESSAAAVFGASNGYLSVWHMDGSVRDELGTVDARDAGTVDLEDGVIGRARHFSGGKGIFCGEKIPDYPAGASDSTTEAWFRTEKPNTTILGWGKEGGQGGKVRMMFKSPPFIHIDSDFADVRSESLIAMARWNHVVHTFDGGSSKVYINGRLEGHTKPPRNILSPARMWIGGWYHNYDFVGDVDEVRISRVARSADWIRMQHENQKPLQTLVGPVVQPGHAFSVSPAVIDVLEGESVTVKAEAGGAQKIYWVLKADGAERVVAIDRYRFTFDAGRVSGNRSLVLQLRAVYPEESRTTNIPILIRESIPEPVFTLAAPSRWDGREPIDVVPRLANREELEEQGVDALEYSWRASGLAVIKEAAAGRLTLKRAQNSGRLTVTASVRNGGNEIRRTAVIQVEEPDTDAWVERSPLKHEQPEDGQFFARNPDNVGTLHYRGTLEGDEPVDAVWLNLYAGKRLVDQQSQTLKADRVYGLSVRLPAGLVKYRVEFGSRIGGRDTPVRSVNDLVCGDAYIIQGQSNAEANDYGRAVNPFKSEWVRSFGSARADPEGSRERLWGNAVSFDQDYHRLQIGYWGSELAKILVEKHKVPVFIINGAKGGTRIDQHQRNESDPTDVRTIYGRLLWRVGQARLTDGIRAVIWHQGENDQGAAGPTGRYGWETYERYFIDLAASWKEDFPNIQSYYLFQIWPKACAMGRRGSDNRLREVQRTLPREFSNMGIQSTLGIRPGGGCHYAAEGYAQFAHLIYPLIARDHYGVDFDQPITPPDLRRAYFTSTRQDEIALEFDQPVIWEASRARHFYLDGVADLIGSGRASGELLTLRLTAPSRAKVVTYVDGESWRGRDVLRGENGLAALTFCQVPIASD